AWSVSLNPNGETYAATGGSGYIVVYSDSWTSLLPLSPDGKRIALSTETGQIYVYDVEGQALRTTYT
ncbi:hypothetical protein B0H14DRAFT_2389996, partial [Mycena olivaceomarginata]